MMYTFKKRLSHPPHNCPNFTLSLTAEERTRTRHRFTMEENVFVLDLPRGTVVRHGDILEAENGELLEILAKPEPVLTVTAAGSYQLLRAAYHLGNRHVSLEITPNYLRLGSDSVIRGMLQNLEVDLVEEIAPFQPEIGAYHHH